jgi:hypothetical protein
MKKKEIFPHEQGARELGTLETVEISLSGWEVYSLIVAVQRLKSASGADIGKTLHIAELTARKLHKTLIPCPHVYTLLDQGWHLGESELNSTQSNDTNS